MRLAASGVRFDAAFASTAPRAVKTARLLLDHAGQEDVPLHVSDGLRECCFGGFEGEYVRTLYALLAERQGYAERAGFSDGHTRRRPFLFLDAAAQAIRWLWPKTTTVFAARTAAVLEELRRAARGCRRVLAVAHGMTITAILKNIDPAATEYRSVPNLSVSRLRSDENGVWRVENVGQTL